MQAFKAEGSAAVVLASSRVVDMFPMQSGTLYWERLWEVTLNVSFLNYEVDIFS